MQVEIKKPSVVDFNKIEVGELFYDDSYDKNNVFMRIKELEDSNGGVSNAICLGDGEFAFYASLDRVNKVSGKLIVTLI